MFAKKFHHLVCTELFQNTGMNSTPCPGLAHVVEAGPFASYTEPVPQEMMLSLTVPLEAKSHGSYSGSHTDPSEALGRHWRERKGAEHHVPVNAGS